MNTPTLSQLFTTISKFADGHKLILTWIAIAGCMAFSYFAPAEQLHQLDKDFRQYKAEDFTRYQLDNVRRQIDIGKLKPAAERTEYEVDTIDRLKREEERLENYLNQLKINS